MPAKPKSPAARPAKRRRRPAPAPAAKRAPAPRRKLALVGPDGTVPPDSAARNTRAALLKAGKTLFAARGYSATSVKQIADLAGVNVSLVSYHFGGKENLYRAILLEFGRERLAVAHRVLQTTGPTEEFRVRAKMFAEEMLNCHFCDTELATILHRALDLGVPIAHDVFRDTFMKVYGTFAEFITAAQKRGLVRPGARGETLAGLLMGMLMNALKVDKLTEIFLNQSLRNEGYRAEVVEHFLELAFPSPFQSKRN